MPRDAELRQALIYDATNKEYNTLMDSNASKRPLKILMVAPQPFFRARGTPFSVLHRIRALCSQGHTVDLVTYPFGEDIELPGLRIFRSGRPFLLKDVKIGPSLAKIALDIPLFFTVRRRLKNNSYDVLHSHEEAAFFCVGLAKRHNLVHLYDMHSSLPHQLENFSSYDFGPIRSLFSWLERRVLTTCNGVITICPELAEIAAPICGSTPHLMIENTADDRIVFGSSDTDIRNDLRLQDSKIVLYTGTFEAYQGLDLLMRAMKSVVQDRENAHLLLVGGQPEQLAKNADLVKSLGLERHVTMVGTVHPSLISAYIDAADIIASPRSSGTNTPLKIYGYLRSGRPLVATNLATHTQVLDDSVALLTSPTSAGLAAGIMTLLDDPILAERLASTAKKRAQQQYSDAAYVGKVGDLYEQIMGQNAGKLLPQSAPL